MSTLRNVYYFCIVFLIREISSWKTIGKTCTTLLGTKGTCTLIQHCKHIELYDIDLIEKSACGVNIRSQEMLVCCPINYNSILPNTSVCGINGIFTNHEIAEQNEFPWLALLKYKKPNGNRGFHCGGVLITKRHVLTAAHCVKDKAKLWKLTSVRLGEYDIENPFDYTYYSLEINIESIKIHENYNPKSNLNDIAILRLTSDVSFSINIQPICLPLIQVLTSEDETFFTVAGWGRTINESRSNVIQKAIIPVRINSACKALYSDSGVKITDNQICAGGKTDQDSNYGDSGGPLMSYKINEKGQANWYVLGIGNVRHSSCGNNARQPGIFTKTTSYKDWILKNLQQSTPEVDEKNGLPDSKDIINKGIESHPNINLLPQTCGSVNNNRISNGNKTELFEFVWMALIYYKNGNVTAPDCGGTLISDRYVLTAAHCLTNLGVKTLDRVFLGEHDTSTDPDFQKMSHYTDNEYEYEWASKVYKAEIEEAIIHPQFSSTTYINDIGLIRLKSPANTIELEPICLPISTTLINEDLFNKSSLMTGWGTTENSIRSTVLLKARLVIQSNETCHKYESAFHGGINSSLQICAMGNAKVNSCTGDSGGPLKGKSHFKKTIVFVQYGILSRGGSKCNSSTIPAVFTRVSKYMHWILDQMRK